jgi:DeoR/GlpR family transcriptional regulator of sugar metabolism
MRPKTAGLPEHNRLDAALGCRYRSNGKRNIDYPNRNKSYFEKWVMSKLNPQHSPADVAEKIASHREPDSAERRRADIVRRLQQEGRVRVTELCKAYSVSEVCIRRDLDILETRGLLRRFHGGAQNITPQGQVLPMEARQMHNIDNKRRIGRVAAQLIQPGLSVLLDAGSTVLEIANALEPAVLADVTIVTRSLTVANVLRRKQCARLVVLGGLYSNKDDSFYGPQTEHMLSGIHVDVAICGADGIALDGGLTTDNIAEATISALMADLAPRFVIAADSSKLGVTQLQAYLPLDRVHTLVTDCAAPDGFVEALKQRGINVMKPDVNAVP